MHCMLYIHVTYIIHHTHSTVNDTDRAVFIYVKHIFFTSTGVARILRSCRGTPDTVFLRTPHPQQLPETNTKRNV